MLHVRRDRLARLLRSHGEDELAERALSVTDDELKRIGELGGDYAFSERALAMGGSIGGAKGLSLATIDVLEGTPRDLRWTRMEGEREMGWPGELSGAEVARDRALPLHARATDLQFVPTSENTDSSAPAYVGQIRLWKAATAAGAAAIAAQPTA